MYETHSFFLQRQLVDIKLRIATEYWTWKLHHIFCAELMEGVTDVQITEIMDALFIMPHEIGPSIILHFTPGAVKCNCWLRSSILVPTYVLSFLLRWGELWLDLFLASVKKNFTKVGPAWKTHISTSLCLYCYYFRSKEHWFQNAVPYYSSK